MTIILSLLLAASAAAAPSSRTPEEFAFDLYRKVAASNPDKNVFISPSSARWALGMAYAGSAGGTRDDMAAVLGARPVAENLKAESARIASLLGADPKVKLLVANGLWLKKGFPFKESFVSAVRQSYRAEVFARDFVPADAAEANSWVSKQTEGKISSIIKEFKPNDRALLVNAVYFKGDWSDKFAKTATKDDDFRLSSGKAVKRKMMDRTGKYDYFAGKDLQAVRLPYGGKRLAMIVLLPGKDAPLTRLNMTLTPAVWREIIGGMWPRRGRVRLPRFQLEFSARLNEPLTALGMGVAFDRMKADFTEMAAAPAPADRLYISSVLQKTFVAVDEEGTEAAAATSVVMASRGSAMPHDPPFDFHADHPFLYAIADRETGEVLFLGALHDPK